MNSFSGLSRSRHKQRNKPNSLLAPYVSRTDPMNRRVPAGVKWTVSNVNATFGDGFIPDTDDKKTITFRTASPAPGISSVAEIILVSKPSTKYHYVGLFCDVKRSSSYRPNSTLVTRPALSLSNRFNRRP